MRKDTTIYLLEATITDDEIGNQIENVNERKVFASELAIYSSTYYNAALTGLRPAKMFEIYTREYREEEKLKHNNVIYRITRTNLGKTPEKTVLTCERVAADG